MTEFEIALEQVKNGEKASKYGCETKTEKNLLALVNKSGLKGTCYPTSKQEELLQLLAVVVEKDNININKLLVNLLEANKGAIYDELTDDAKSYTKTTPNSALPYARVNYVGGMSYKSENLVVLTDTVTTTKNGITYSIANGVVTISGKPTSSYTSIISQSIYTLLEDGKTYTLRCKELTVNPNMFAQINMVKNDDSREYYSLNSKNSMQFTVDKSLYKDAIFIIQSGKELAEVNNLTITPEVVLGNGITHSKVTNINELVIPNEVLNLEGYGLGINDTYYNYIDFDNKKYVQKVASYTFDGTETWLYNETGNTDTSKLYRFNTDIIANKVKTDFEKTTDITLTEFTNSNTWQEEENSLQIHSTTSHWILIGNIFVFNSKIQSDVAMQQYMKGRTIVYALAEPIETDISSYIDNGYIKVDSGGSITFENEYKHLVPNSITYQVLTNVLLWENPSPNEAFTAKEIELTDDIIGYEFCVDYKLYSNTGSNHGLMRQYYANASENSYYVIYGVEVQDGNNALKSRKISVIDNNKISIGSGYLNGEVNDNHCVPVRIYRTKKS